MKEDKPALEKLAEVGSKLDRQDAARRALGKRMFEVLDDGVLVVDRDGVIILANPATEMMFLYPKEEIVGQPVHHLLPAKLRERHASHLKNYFADPRQRTMGANLSLTALRKDGTEIPVLISLSPLIGDELFAVAVIRRKVG